MYDMNDRLVDPLTDGGSNPSPHIDCHSPVNDIYDQKLNNMDFYMHGKDVQVIDSVNIWILQSPSSEISPLLFARRDDPNVLFKDFDPEAELDANKDQYLVLDQSTGQFPHFYRKMDLKQFEGYMWHTWDEPNKFNGHGTIHSGCVPKPVAGQLFRRSLEFRVAVLDKI